jgi:hypothetical protein
MDYRETLEDILELDESGIVVVSGYADLVLIEGKSFSFKDLKEDNIWIKFGRADQSQVLESLLGDNEYKLGDDCIEGEYSFDMIFRWEKGEYYEHRLISPGYLDLRYVNWKFIQTFEQRKREIKLNDLLNLDDLFSL